jgi:tRNA U54 and U55 pseudouridine synthase Pus10
LLVSGIFKAFLKLKFTAKAVGQAKVDITKGRISDTEQEVDVADDQCGEKIINIQGGSSDVNRSGEFTLLDLAIDARYHVKTVAETDSTKYDADVVANGSIDDQDLTEIVAKMMQNTNYAPNNS